MRKAYLLAVVLLLYISQVCMAQTKQKNTDQNQGSFSALENKIIDTIVHLPEVKKRALYVKNQTKGKRQLQYMIQEKPTKETPYYVVTAAEDNGTSYYTHFTFYVYPKTLVIKYYDVVNDTAISLDKWRKDYRD